MNPDEVYINQNLWVIQIKKSLQTHSEKEEEKEMVASIFGVPKELFTMKPDAYVPQCVSIEPYHHWRSQLCEMESYKVAAARRFQNMLAGDCKFEYVVGEVKKYDWQIRMCYQKCLDYKEEEALAWLIALDASFVLECLQFYTKGVDHSSSQLSSQLKRLGRSATHNAIMRDLMMLENQIPLFLLQKLLKIQLGCQHKAEERLSNLVTLACEQWSPFMLKTPDRSRLCIKTRGHLLEVLYHSIVPSAVLDDTFTEKNDDVNQVPETDPAYIKRAVKALWRVLSSLTISLVQLVSLFSDCVFKGRAAHFATQLARNLASAFETGSINRNVEREYSSPEIPPSRDELEIPSVSDLCWAGVRFVPAEGDLSTVRFEPSTATLYLPRLRLDSNTEVVLRNLAAFEASAAPGDLAFSRYTDFMNGIIDTEEDVGLLRRRGIICNQLADDGKLASLWNGMGRCVKLTRVKYLDQVIADVNTHYNNR